MNQGTLFQTAGLHQGSKAYQHKMAGSDLVYILSFVSVALRYTAQNIVC